MFNSSVYICIISLITIRRFDSYQSIIVLKMMIIIRFYANYIIFDQNNFSILNWIKVLFKLRDFSIIDFITI